jgi:hypothetical protein
LPTLMVGGSTARAVGLVMIEYEVTDLFAAPV